MPAPAGQLTRLAVKTPGKVTFVELDQIQAIEAAGKYVVVHVGHENHVLRETMNSLESHLPPQRFLRISRSVIVNIHQVQELQPMFKGETLVVLKNGKSYPTTRPRFAKSSRSWNSARARDHRRAEAFKNLLHRRRSSVFDAPVGALLTPISSL